MGFANFAIDKKRNQYEREAVSIYRERMKKNKN
jgi:hypothetical protein